MNTEEFIEYLMTNIRMTLVKSLPEYMNKEYLVDEATMIRLGKAAIDQMFDHVNDGILLSYLINQKKERA